MTREEGIKFLLKNGYEEDADLAEETVDDFINHFGLSTLEENLIKFSNVSLPDFSSDVLREYRINADGHWVDD